MKKKSTLIVSSNPMYSLPNLVDIMMSLDKMITRCKVRQSHLKKNGRVDLENALLLEELEKLKKYMMERVAELISQHPAYHWFSRIRGVGDENIAKVIGLARVKPEKGFNKEGDEIDRPYADTISALWKYAGFSVEDGKAPKRETGKTLTYNSELRSMCYRLATSLTKSGLRQQCSSCGEKFGATDSKTKKPRTECPQCGCEEFGIVATTKFAEYFLKHKAELYKRYQDRGWQIVPAASLPKNKNGKYEPEGMISEGHVHNQALRKMIKLFLSCLWIEWRKAEGMPVTTPYSIGILQHAHYIDPWDMVDEEEKPKKKPKKASAKKKTSGVKRASQSK